MLLLLLKNMSFLAFQITQVHNISPSFRDISCITKLNKIIQNSKGINRSKTKAIDTRYQRELVTLQSKNKWSIDSTLPKPLRQSWESEWIMSHQNKLSLVGHLLWRSRQTNKEIFKGTCLSQIILETTV